jgi:hypothetical protein
MIFSPFFPTRLKYHEQEYVQPRQFLPLYCTGVREPGLAETTPSKKLWVMSLLPTQK